MADPWELAVKALKDPAVIPFRAPPPPGHRFVVVDAGVRNAGTEQVEWKPFETVFTLVDEGGNRYPEWRFPIMDPYPKTMRMPPGSDPSRLPALEGLPPGAEWGGFLTFMLPNESRIVALTAEISWGDPQAGQRVTLCVPLGERPCP